MACSNEIHPKAADRVFGTKAEECCSRPTPDYVGKVAYIMDGSDYGHRSGMYFIVAQDGDRRIDAIALVIGYNGHEIRRFNLYDKEETANGTVRITPGAKLLRVREDNYLVLDWAGRQYRWGKKQDKDLAKPQWCSSVYTAAIAMAELSLTVIDETFKKQAKVEEELRAHHTAMFKKAVKDYQLRQAYGG